LLEPLFFFATDAAGLLGLALLAPFFAAFAPLSAPRLAVAVGALAPLPLVAGLLALLARTTLASPDGTTALPARIVGAGAVALDFVGTDEPALDFVGALTAGLLTAAFDTSAADFASAALALFATGAALTGFATGAGATDFATAAAEIVLATGVGAATAADAGADER